MLRGLPLKKCWFDNMLEGPAAPYEDLSDVGRGAPGSLSPFCPQGKKHKGQEDHSGCPCYSDAPVQNCGPLV